MKLLIVFICGLAVIKANTSENRRGAWTTRSRHSAIGNLKEGFRKGHREELQHKGVFENHSDIKHHERSKPMIKKMISFHGDIKEENIDTRNMKNKEKSSMEKDFLIRVTATKQNQMNVARRNKKERPFAMKNAAMRKMKNRRERKTLLAKSRRQNKLHQTQVKLSKNNRGDTHYKYKNEKLEKKKGKFPKKYNPHKHGEKKTPKNKLSKQKRKRQKGKQ